jgi:hypothetical protein
VQSGTSTLVDIVAHPIALSVLAESGQVSLQGRRPDAPSLQAYPFSGIGFLTGNNVELIYSLMYRTIFLRNSIIMEKTTEREPRIFSLIHLCYCLSNGIRIEQIEVERSKARKNLYFLLMLS